MPLRAHNRDKADGNLEPVSPGAANRRSASPPCRPAADYRIRACLMHLLYVDESYERPTTTTAAIAVPAESWRKVFERIKRWRHELKETDGILMRKELHATEFVAGRGNLGPRTVGKFRRSQIFYSAFVMMNSMPELRVFSTCRNDHPEWAFGRLLTRIHRTMETWNSHALLICDVGNEAEYVKQVRKMSVRNVINVGPYSNNVRTTRIIEDPFFKSSDKSYFIQLADFCSYALLRREKRLPSKDKYGIHRAFDELKDVVVREVAPRDPMGIIR